jgi:hypothetical protein
MFKFLTVRTVENLSLLVAKTHNALSSTLFPNRAQSRPHLSNITSAFSLSQHHWSGARARCYNLDNLAVDEEYRSGQVGRRLVQNGLEKAARLNVSSSVVSAKGKDPFYMSCGFVTKVGSVTEGEGNPLTGIVGGGSILFWDPPSQGS